MINRRAVLAGTAALAATGAGAVTRSADFDAFVTGVKAEAGRAGIGRHTLDAAFAGVAPNARVIELDRQQPEFTLTWAQYRAKLVTEKRIAQGREVHARDRRLIDAACARYGADPGVVLGIWGLESNFGTTKGNFGVVEALATLAWEGRRASFFRAELIASLRILDHGDVSPARMTGSYAGAMGQPQFMPSSYLRYAVDYDGNGRRDIWDSEGDSIGSIANYLAASGWRRGEPWGQAVTVPPGFAQAGGRDDRRSLGEWGRLGVRRADGTAFGRGDVTGAVIEPDGAGGEAFMVYGNFAAIRRYNPSDFYALAVGLIGGAILA